MKVKVSYFGHLRIKAGVKTESYDVGDGTTMGTLLETVCRARDIGDLVFEQSSVNLLVNGRNIKFLDDMDTVLSDGDEVSIFPPTGGG